MGLLIFSLVFKWGTWFSGGLAVRLVAGLSSLKGLFQTKRIYDSKYQIKLRVFVAVCAWLKLITKRECFVECGWCRVSDNVAGRQDSIISAK